MFSVKVEYDWAVQMP